MVHQATVILHFSPVRRSAIRRSSEVEARQTIEPGYYQDVTFAQMFDQLLEPGAIAPRAGDFLFEQLFASGGGERALALAVEVLILGRDPGIHPSLSVRAPAGFAKHIAKKRLDSAYVFCEEKPL